LTSSDNYKVTDAQLNISFTKEFCRLCLLISDSLT